MIDCTRQKIVKLLETALGKDHTWLLQVLKELKSKEDHVVAATTAIRSDGPNRFPKRKKMTWPSRLARIESQQSFSFMFM